MCKCCDAHIQEAELRYASDLTLARSDTDQFEDLEACGFLTLPCADLAGRRVVLVVPDKLPAHISGADFERVYQYIIVTLDAIVDSEYTVVYAHTGAADWKARPSVLWLRGQYERCARAVPCASLFVTVCAAPSCLPLRQYTSATRR